MTARRLLPSLLLAAVLTIGGCATAESGSGTTEVVRPAPVADRTSIPPTPADVDVLLHLTRYPGTETQHAPDGTTRVPKFGSGDLEEAETALVGVLPRPWTVSVLRDAWIDASRPDDATGEVDPAQEATRAALITLLGASRDEDVLRLVGEALSDPQLQVRVAATYTLLDYWVGYSPPGGTESAMYAAGDWWSARRDAR